MKRVFFYIFLFFGSLMFVTLHASDSLDVYSVGDFVEEQSDCISDSLCLDPDVCKTVADSAYAAEDYDRAIALYVSLLRLGESADVHYNLGNCYFKTDSLARAILHYERAALLQPNKADILFNLEMARMNTIDKITPESEMFFVTWYNILIDKLSADAWAMTAVAAFALTCIFALLFFLGRSVGLKKFGFFGAVVMIIVVVLANVFARTQQKELDCRTGAIVMTSSVVVKSTPNESGTDLFVLHEGTRVEIVDNAMKEWKEIRIADGKIGWMPAKCMEVI